MAELDLGPATQWNEGETHGRVKLVGNETYPETPEKNVAIISPNSVEIQLNSNLSSSQEADKVYFTTYHGSTKKVVGILDSEGDLYIAGKVITDQKNLSL
ncbi:DUF6342 family protein [Streptomyces griseoviridis]|uniref:Uncharacterized protein n=3 Tax=Streptomyces TaxID=1883 RepID=A0A918GNB2_STRGD|nr:MULTISPECIES: DUF6342 family protein [Streptomyces]MDP9680259.1 hypothetical protein [Streptomyces griseoviridis]GGS50067.1 hypothetical protein GCM10010238_44480 [Streptomyces niveoruber]GGT24808.1 hypothetical protein GCM10010240_66610 [Streptomyces griseoviridis]GGU48454.1 hypothetical protein GCM10010259_44440 [Streptomyces daghestanicus]GHI29226.1 hypothetical protein Sdagh_09560 [Streptomyces daghestanicus]